MTWNVALRRALSTSALAFLFVLPTSAWALLSDDEARKAILDLRKTLASTQLELQSQIERLKSENAQLRGQIENLQRQSEEFIASQKTNYQDLDTRLSKFEPRTLEIEGVTGTIQPGEKAAYDEALAAFQAGQLKKADTGFTSFVRKYNASPYLPLALYWLGNTKYALKEYPGAISQLQALIKAYPKHPRIPAAMLTLGNCQLESGNKTAARKTYGDLIASYPDSEVAVEARQMLPRTK
ncbi:tol-pal system protein YbgF [Polynucleobacter sp.]|uniref:tol-pal system protein YbgF n=1 Tax=Polynucleobacter sp. TaxID=2029855 RepID=UPI0027351C87|nr:tol-pal system protein YbgF [Polynucleobacter sp.]MDP3122684.1 tol-pal system protein YbgF [Polynucleobacter sp.]